MFSWKVGGRNIYILYDRKPSICRLRNVWTSQSQSTCAQGDLTAKFLISIFATRLLNLRKPSKKNPNCNFTFTLNLFWISLIFKKLQILRKILDSTVYTTFWIFHIYLCRPWGCLNREVQIHYWICKWEIIGGKSSSVTYPSFVHLTSFVVSKGQLISEWNFGVFKSSKKTTKFLTGFCPSFIVKKIDRLFGSFEDTKTSFWD